MEFTTDNEAHIHRIQAALRELGADFDPGQHQIGLDHAVLGYTQGSQGPDLTKELARLTGAMPEMSGYPLKSYEELDLQQRQRLLNLAAGVITWIEEQDLLAAPQELIRDLAAAAAGEPTPEQVERMFEAAPQRETEDADEAVQMARRSHRTVYSWQTIGRSNWLQKRLHAADTLQLVIMPPGLPDHIDLPDDPED